jgi:hypothetical protein
MRTIKLAIMIGGAAYMLSSSGPSLAQSADTEADLRCLAIAGIALATSNNNSEIKKGSELMMTFFLGKLNGRDPSLSIKSGLDRIMPRMTLGEIEKEAEQCSKAMEAISKEFEQGNPVKR